MRSVPAKRKAKKRSVTSYRCTVQLHRCSGDGALLLCVADSVNTDVIHRISGHKPVRAEFVQSFECEIPAAYLKAIEVPR